jgi:hypothetical protein
MGSLQTVLPLKLAATDEALTAHGGWRWLANMFEQWAFAA